MGTKCTQYSKSWKFYCSVIQGLRVVSIVNRRTLVSIFGVPGNIVANLIPAELLQTGRRTLYANMCNFM